MHRTTLTLLPLALGVAAALTFACTRQETPPAPQPAEATPTTAAPPGPTHACAPAAELNALDTRRPVPLQPMMAWHQKQSMMEHLSAIQGITQGLAHDDWAAIERSAALIGSSPQEEQLCRHMGAGAEGFTELALDFHRRADQIGVAARQQDRAGVLRATSETLEACTGCHATYRQDVVDATTWQARTGSDHAPMMHGAH